MTWIDRANAARESTIAAEQRLTKKGYAAKRGKMWAAYNNCFVILLTDKDTGIDFVQCKVKLGRNGRPETIVAAFPDRTTALKCCNDKAYREWWLGYTPRVIRYEALKEFEDTYQRQHWRFATKVMFVGASTDMQWLAQLTMKKGGGLAFDKKKGLIIPTRALTAARPSA